MHRRTLTSILAAVPVLLPASAGAVRPDRVWGTYHGGSASDSVIGAAIDGAGDLVVCGQTASTSGLTTPGVHQTVHGGGAWDAFVARFSADGQRLWATYIGGADADYCYAVAFDGAGAVLAVGKTESADGIATAGALQEAAVGAGDGFVVKLDADGQRVWGTYVAGPAQDQLFSVTTGADDSVYVSGRALGPLAIALPGPHDPTHGGDSDILALRLTPAGAMVWGTYLGGEAAEDGLSIAVRGDVVAVAGAANSPDLATPGAFDTTVEGSGDAIVARFDTDGVLLWSTYYGQDGYDSMVAAITADGGVVGFGYTDSPTGISTAGAHQEVYGGNSDTFLVRFDADGARQWATYIGGDAFENAKSVIVDPAGNLVVYGETRSTAGIATPDAFQPAHGGLLDTFTAKFDPSGARRWATYYGGPGNDRAFGTPLADGVDTIVISGATSSTSAIATPDAFQTNIAGGDDGFLARFTQGQGDACTDDAACEAGLCVDGVCCDDLCGDDITDDCRACSVAAGAARDGTCGLLADATPCADGLCMAGTCTPDNPTGTGTGTTDADTAPTPTTSTAGDSNSDADTAANPTTSTASDSNSDGAPTGDSDGRPTGSAPDDDSTGSLTDSSTTTTARDPTAAGDSGCGCRESPVPQDISLLALALLALPRRRR